MPLRTPDIVILAGSGRSGTTWLGSILNSYEFAEYFYEICAFPELDFDDPGLLEVKYPLTSWMSRHPGWVHKFERYLLAKRVRWGILPDAAARSLRIHSDYDFQKNRATVHLFKIVALFSFVSRIDRLSNRLGERLKVVHIIRNPYSQLASELKMDARNPEKSRRHFRERMDSILQDEALTPYHGLVREHLDKGWVAHMAVVWWISNELLLNDNKLEKQAVVYEDLCRDPYGETQRIFDFLGWPFSDQTRDHIRNTTNISQSQSESGMFSIKKNADESINKWRKQMDADTYSTIKETLAECPFLDLWSDSDLSLENRKQSPD